MLLTLLTGTDRMTDRATEAANAWVSRWWGVIVGLGMMGIAGAFGFAWQSNVTLTELSVRMEIMNQERADSGKAIRDGVSDLNRRIDAGVADLQKKLDTTVAVLAALQGRSDVFDTKLTDHQRRIEIQERAVEQLREAIRELEEQRRTAPPSQR